MATFQKRANGTWTAKVRRLVDGKLKKKSQTFESRAAAEKWALQYEAKLLDGEYRDQSHNKSVSLAELTKLYERDFVHRMKSAKSVRNRLKQWCREPFADLPAMSLATADLNEWVARAEEDGLSASTIHNMINVLSGCYSKVSRWKFTFPNPCKGVIKPKKKKPRYIVVPDADIERVREACWSATRSPYLGYIFEIAVRTGMRQGEIRALRRQYIDLEHGIVHIPETKNDTPRDVVMLLGSKPFFEKALKLTEREDGYLFGDPFLPVAKGGITQDQVTAAFANAVEKLENLAVPDLTFHDLRHLACTRLSKIFPNPLALARQTGHKTPSQLFRYYNPDVRAEAEELFEREEKLEKKRIKKARKKAEEAAAREAELLAQLETEKKEKREMEMAKDAAEESSRFYRLMKLREQPQSAKRDALISKLEGETRAYHAKWPEAPKSWDLHWEELEQARADELHAGEAEMSALAQQRLEDEMEEEMRKRQANDDVEALKRFQNRMRKR